MGQRALAKMKGPPGRRPFVSNSGYWPKRTSSANLSIGLDVMRAAVIAAIDQHVGNRNRASRQVDRLRVWSSSLRARRDPAEVAPACIIDRRRLPGWLPSRREHACLAHRSLSSCLGRRSSPTADEPCRSYDTAPVNIAPAGNLGDGVHRDGAHPGQPSNVGT